MKRQLAKLLAADGYDVVDFGNKVYDAADDDAELLGTARRTLSEPSLAVRSGMFGELQK